MKELTESQRAEVNRLKRTDGGSVEAKYLEILRAHNPHLTDNELRRLCLFTDDLVKVIDTQKDAIGERDALLKKAYDSIDNYKVWAWAASVLCVILFLLATGIVRLP